VTYEYNNTRSSQHQRPSFKVAETPVEALNQLNATLRKISYILGALNESVREANVKHQAAVSLGNLDREEGDLGFFADNARG
jgi:hypothetical protein